MGRADYPEYEIMLLIISNAFLSNDLPFSY